MYPFFVYATNSNNDSYECRTYWWIHKSNTLHTFYTQNHHTHITCPWNGFWSSTPHLHVMQLHCTRIKLDLKLIVNNPSQSSECTSDRSRCDLWPGVLCPIKYKIHFLNTIYMDVIGISIHINQNTWGNRHIILASLTIPSLLQIMFTYI